jgi:hypothetical protein
MKIENTSYITMEQIVERKQGPFFSLHLADILKQFRP